MEKKKSKTTLAIILVGILGVISIAYAAISTTLFITSGGSATGNPNEDAGAESGATASASVRFLGTNSGEKDEKYGSDSTGIVSTDAKGNATATTGTVTITNTSKNNDTALIKDTDLGGFDSYVIYKLGVKNEGSKPAKLKNVPNVNIRSDSDVKKNIEVKIYTDKLCEKELKLWDENNDTADNSKANYLLAQQDATGENADKNKTTWYVKVRYKPVEKFITGEFGFDLNPVWEVVG